MGFMTHGHFTMNGIPYRGHNDAPCGRRLLLRRHRRRRMSWRCGWSWRILPILEQIFNPSDVGRARQQRPVSMVSFSRRTGYMDEGIPNFDGFRCISRKVLKQNKRGAWVGIGWITEWKKLRDCAVYSIVWRSLLHSYLIRFNGRSCMEEA